jgi:hypothetical protein
MGDICSWAADQEKEEEREYLRNKGIDPDRFIEEKCSLCGGMFSYLPTWGMTPTTHGGLAYCIESLAARLAMVESRG